MKGIEHLHLKRVGYEIGLLTLKYIIYVILNSFGVLD